MFLFGSYFFVTSKELSTATVREVRLVCEPPANPVTDDNGFSLNIGEIKVCACGFYLDNLRPDGACIYSNNAQYILIYEH